MPKGWSVIDVVVSSGSWSQVLATINCGSFSVYNQDGADDLRISPDSLQAEEVLLAPGGQQVFGDGARQPGRFQFVTGQPLCWLRSMSGTWTVKVVQM